MSKEIVLNDNVFLVSETDSKGFITYANEQFCKVAQYDFDELVGQSHNIVRHPDMPKNAFKELWETVKKGNVWQGYVKNKTKENNYYWVFATVYPYENEAGEQCYMSCRRKPERQKIEEIKKLYKKMF